MSPDPCGRTLGCPKPSGHVGPCPGQFKGRSYPRRRPSSTVPCPTCPPGSDKMTGHAGRHIGSTNKVPRADIGSTNKVPRADRVQGKPVVMMLRSPSGRIVDVVPKRLRFDRFIAYPPVGRLDQWATQDRPLCALCGSRTQKRVVFFDRRHLRQPLCAKCAVDKQEANAVHV